MHAIKTPQQLRVPEAGGPDNDRDSSLPYFKIHNEKNLMRAITKIDILDPDHDRLARFGFRRFLQFQRRSRVWDLFFFHYYHDRLFRVLLSSTMAARAIAKTSKRRIQAAPHCIRSGYS